MAETPGNPDIDTSSGMANSGSISAGDNNFFGRDQINIFQGAPAQIGGKPSIPRPPADFVGREAELDALCQSVEKGAIITGLHGLGGIGKTALALKAAERLQPRCPDGGIYLDLHGPDPNLLTSEQALEHFIRVFCPAAQLPESRSGLQAVYAQVLGDKKLLLLLDNARDNNQVTPLLEVLPPGCLALVTSRKRFAYPGMTDRHLDVLPQGKAVQLLRKIAPRVGKQAAELTEVCGYLPLALRTIGSLLREQINLTPEDVLAFMQDATTRLKMTKVDASLELSYRILPEHLRESWRKLGVFAGDFDEQAAAWVWRIIKEGTAKENTKRMLLQVKQTLGELITYSLVEYKDERYRLHDLARLFAAGRLSEEEEYTARLIHTQYYFQVLRACDDLYLQGNEKILKGLAWFDRERREISAGQDWAAGSLREDVKNTAVDQASRLRMCCDYPNAGAYVLPLRLHPRERIRWLEQALSAARQLNDRQAEGNRLGSLGNAYADLGEVQRAIAHYEQHLAISRDIDDQFGEGIALNNLGLAYGALGETWRAIAYYEQTLAIVREIGDQRGRGNALGNLGNAYFALGEIQRAIGYYEQALAVVREIGDQLGEGAALGNLGLAFAALGKVQRAIEYYEQSLAIKRETCDRRGEGASLGNLGLAYADLGEVQRAIGYYEQQLTITHETGDRRGEGNTLNNLGTAYAALGEVQRAIGYYEQSLAIKHETGDQRGEANTCWNLGLVHEKQGNLVYAVELMQVRVDYLRSLGHPDAEKRVAYVDAIRARMTGGGPPG